MTDDDLIGRAVGLVVVRSIRGKVADDGDGPVQPDRCSPARHCWSSFVPHCTGSLAEKVDLW